VSRYVTPCEEDIQRQILTPSGPFASMHYTPCVINIKTRRSSGQTILSSSITVSISHCIVFCERDNYQVMCLRTRIRRICWTCGLTADLLYMKSCKHRLMRILFNFIVQNFIC